MEYRLETDLILMRFGKQELRWGLGFGGKKTKNPKNRIYQILLDV